MRGYNGVTYGGRVDVEEVEDVVDDGVLDETELSGVAVRRVHVSDHVADVGVVVHPEVVPLHHQHVTTSQTRRPVHRHIAHTMFPRQLKTRLFRPSHPWTSFLAASPQWSLRLLLLGSL